MLRFNLARPNDEPPAARAAFVVLARLRREVGETRRELDRLDDELARALDELLDGHREEPA